MDGRTGSSLSAEPRPTLAYRIPSSCPEPQCWTTAACAGSITSAMRIGCEWAVGSGQWVLTDCQAFYKRGGLKGPLQEA